MCHRYLYCLSVICLLPFSQCCHSFGKVLAEVTPKRGYVFNQTIQGCVSANSLNTTVTVRAVKIINQPVTRLKQGGVEDMESLIHIEFKKCYIEEIRPRSFRNLPDLEKIFVNYGALQQINKGVFVNLPNIKKISLSHNKISDIEIGSFDVPTLQILHVWDNKLKSWNRNWFSSFRDLVEIDIRNNLISDLPSNAFNKFENLTKLVLDSNMITSININAFEGLYKLKDLGLTYNLLTEIDVNWFPNRMSLSRLTVNANRLNYISLQVLQRIKPKQISLDGNPWKCECWKNVLVWMQDNGCKIVTTVNCQSESVPVCVSLENPNTCDENIDEKLTEKFYDEVKKSVKDINSVKRMKCYRFD